MAAPIPLPTGAPATTLPAAYFNLYLAGTRVGGGLTFESDEQFTGQWVQPFGSDGLIRQPGMRSGRGSFTRVELFGNTIRDIIMAAHVGVTSQQLATLGLDLRFYPFTASGQYNDGTKQLQITLNDVYLTRVGWQVSDGTRLVGESVDFEFSTALYQ